MQTAAAEVVGALRHQSKASVWSQQQNCATQTGCHWEELLMGWVPICLPLQPAPACGLQGGLVYGQKGFRISLGIYDQKDTAKPVTIVPVFPFLQKIRFEQTVMYHVLIVISVAQGVFWSSLIR